MQNARRVAMISFRSGELFLYRKDFYAVSQIKRNAQRKFIDDVLVFTFKNERRLADKSHDRKTLDGSP